jgi:hypothetical protein
MSDDIAREPSFGLRAVYPDVTYELPAVAQHLWIIDGTWQLCRALADWRVAAPLFGTREQEMAWVRERMGKAPADRLVISRLRIGSPMELSLEVVGGMTTISVTALFLLKHILHNPKAVGAWLPGVVAEWHSGWAKAEQAKADRKALTARLAPQAISEGRTPDRPPGAFEPLRERGVAERRENPLTAYEEPPVWEAIDAANMLAELPPAKVTIEGPVPPPPPELAALDDEDETLVT